MSVDLKQTKRIAQLARLGLSDDEILAFSLELSQIIEFADALQQADLDGVEPLHSVLEAASPDTLRADEVLEVPDRDRLQQCAENVSEQRVVDGFYVVPKFITKP